MSILKNFHPPTLKDLRALRKPVRNMAAEQENSMTRLDRAALAITARVGSFAFFLLVLVWTVLWLGWNTIAPPALRFDPPTGFVLWLFISNMIQLMLMPLLLVGQNLLGRYADRRSQNDYEVNLKAEREIDTVLQHLEQQRIVLLLLARKAGITDDELAALMRDAAPARSATQ